MSDKELTRENSGDPLKTYLILQLTAAQKQLRLIGPDGDIEALHRFRVALRRFRSLLHTYAKALYAPDAVAKSMLSATNPLREIDVFFASLDNTAYPRLYAAVEKERRTLYRNRWTSDTVERFEHALVRLSGDISRLAFESRTKKMLKRVDKLDARAKEAHERLGANSPEDAVHNVRLLYKQLRYALEFLSDAGLIDGRKKIKRVKKILEHFGAVQDAADQLRWLENFCSAHPHDECGHLVKARKKQLKALKKAF